MALHPALRRKSGAFSPWLLGLCESLWSDPGSLPATLPPGPMDVLPFHPTSFSLTLSLLVNLWGILSPLGSTVERGRKEEKQLSMVLLPG